MHITLADIEGMASPGWTRTTDLSIMSGEKPRWRVYETA